MESIGLSVSRLSSDHLPFSRWLVSDLTGLRQSSSAMVTNGTSVTILEKCDKLSQYLSLTPDQGHDGDGAI